MLQMPGHRRHLTRQQRRCGEVVLADHREEFFRRLGRVGVDQRLPTAVHLGAERVVGLLEIRCPLRLPRPRQRRRAVDRPVQRIDLVRHLMHRHAEPGFGIGDVGLDVGPGENQRTAVPGFADQCVVPFVQHAGGIHMAALHAERFGINDQLRPATQADFAQFQQRQAAQRGQQHAVGLIELQFGGRADRLLV